MKINFCCFIITLLVVGVFNSSCSNIENKKDKKGITLHIKKDTLIEPGKTLIINAGSELIFYDSAKIIVKGSLQVIGNKNDKVIMKPEKAENNWGGIQLINPDDSCFITGLIIYNGLIYGEDVDFVMNKSEIYNNQPLEQFDALIRLFRGSVAIKESYFESNHTGEGILIHKTHSNSTIVENCEFNGVSDAIEYLNVFENGIIRNNKIRNIKQWLGDGIDLNGCRSVLIEGNYFDNIKDFGIETGNDKYGPSKNIIIANNIFSNCLKGVVVKGGSDAIVINNTFYANMYGVSCMGETYGSNFNPNSIEVINSIFSQSRTKDWENNVNSTISFSHCLSDTNQLNGDSNLFEDPFLIDPAKGDFRLSNNSKCIGTGVYFELGKFRTNCMDLGAVCFIK